MSAETVSEAIAPHLPYLRRYARALSGSQASGDRVVMATLEAIIADPSIVDGFESPRVGLYAAFQQLWSATSAEMSAAPDDDAAISKGLRALTPTSRQALLLFAMEEFGYRDVATILDAPKELATKWIDEAVEEMNRQARSRVLIIEDEPIIAMDIHGIVEGLGHAVVDIADTRTLAVEAAKRHKPDLIMADIQLADGSSGADAVADILKEFDAPVVFVTAFPDRLLTGERPEPTFLITKPFREEAVEAAISQAVFFRTSA